MTSPAPSPPDAEFADVAARYRRRLHVHCYRVLGSFDEAEDLVQETFLRAWRAWSSFEGRSSPETWLYRIATNACLNALQRAPTKHVLPQDVVAPVTATTDPGAARSEPPMRPDLPWLQPYPDELLDDPANHAVSRETIELAYLVALQQLPPRQRAVLILRDVLGWSAAEVASLLELSTAAANSALQRARGTLRAALPTHREQWSSELERTDQEQQALSRFMAAWERADAAAITSMLRDDARWSMPPAALWFDGRAAIERLLTLFPLAASGEFRTLAVGANRQPAVAGYLRPPGDSVFHLNGVTVLRIDDQGQIAEITAFGAALCRAFTLPETLAADDR